jgi:hypothetical protein
MVYTRLVFFAQRCSLQSLPFLCVEISNSLDTTVSLKTLESVRVSMMSIPSWYTFLRVQKFLFSSEHDEAITKIVSSLLPDERREVSNVSVAALMGIKNGDTIAATYI